MDRVRCICFTLNNWTEVEKQSLLEYEYFDYCILGFEGKDKTEHIQGYAELSKRMTFKQLKKFNNRWHIQKRRGTQEEAINYCKKEGDFIEIGEKRTQGKRNDLNLIRTEVKIKGMRGILELETCPNMQQIRVAEKYLSYCEEKRDFKPEVTWIFGRSGVGKTKLAHELAGNNVYIKDESKWWDGYDKHESIIIDDFRGNQMNFTYLLKILDRYAMQLQVKGGYRQLVAKKIFITSIKKPSETYKFMEEDEPKEQLLRRIDKFITFDEYDCETEVDRSRG